MTRAEAIARANEYYARRQSEINDELSRREREIRDALPEVRQLMDERAELPVKSMRLAMADRPNAAAVAAEMRRRGLELNAAIRKALAEKGYGEDYLSPRYECAACRDTGYLSGQVPACMCACMERRISALMSESGQEGAFGASFHMFDESRVPDEPVLEGLTQRALTVRIRQACEDYVNSYPGTILPGLILSGQPGLGKTFLMGCIRTGLEEKGVCAVSLGSYKLLQRLRAMHFHEEGAEEAFDELIRCPVLLIDDLGSEPVLKNVSEEYLCVLLDERMRAGRHTVITTNLTPPQMKEIYSERVASRLSDVRFWDHLRLLGKDLRRT